MDFDFTILGWLGSGTTAGFLGGGEIIKLSSDEDSDSDLELSGSPGSSMSKEILEGVMLFLLDIPYYPISSLSELKTGVYDMAVAQILIELTIKNK